MKHYWHISAILPLFLPFLLLSCASVAPQAPEPQTEAPVAAPAPARPAQQETGHDLDPATLYDVLLGEIAARRGRLEVAADALLRAAHRSRDAQLAERATLAALQGKRYEEARAGAALWSELEPGSAEAREALAIALLELRRVGEARAALGAMLDAAGTREDLAQAYLRAAAVLGRASARDRALEVMRQLVDMHPKVPAAHFALAHLAVRTGELDAAAAAVERALALRPGWQDAALFKARILVSQQDAPGAQRWFEEFLEAHPGATQVRLQYARHLIDQKQWEQARDQFKQVVERNPDDADSVYAVALLALQTNRLEEAERYFRRVLELRPDNDQARLYLGQTLEEVRRYADAARLYRRVGEGEFFLEARSRLAVVTAKQGDIAKARALLHATPAASEEERVQLVLAEEQLLRDAKRYREALSVMNAALERMPGNAHLLYARALVAERLDLLELLESDLRAILAREPNNANALNALGYTLADRTDRLAEAEQLLMKALAQRPDDPFVLDSVGWLYYRQGRNPEALEYLKRALSIRGDAEIAAHLGEVLWVTGERREAESVWTRALKDTPDSEVLRDVIRKFKP